MRNIWRVIRFIPEYRGRILGVFVVGTVLGAVSTATPFLYKHIVDVIAALLSGQVSAQQASASVALLLALFFGLRVLMVLFSALQDKQSDDLWLDTVSTFRQRVFDNMTRMSIDYFEKKRVGEIMDRFGHITTITMWLFSLTEGTLPTRRRSILQRWLPPSDDVADAMGCSLLHACQTTLNSSLLPGKKLCQFHR